MTILSRTIRAAELSESLRKEIGVGADQLVKIAIEEVADERSPAEIAALQEGLWSIVPGDIEGDVTSFIRSERDRLDGRNARS
jgi:hypothetical protein